MDDSNDETSSYSDGFASISCNSEDKKEVTKHSKYRLASTSQTIKNLEDISSLISRATATNVIKKIGSSQQIKRVPPKNITSTEPFCHVKLDSIVQLKESTKKLLCLLEDIQLKSKVRQSPSAAKTWKRRESVTPIPTEIDINSMTEVCSSALKRLETQTQLLENITTADEDDDCSVFKKLTRKCNCLTQHEYNDFVIQFNEETKYFTNTSGEIIKNLRILKKFLYMGGDYTKHALMFLNEGLNDCSYAEKVEIMQGCAFTDMCNVFEDVSLVISGIAWPYKYDSYGDSVTQELVASFLFKLSQLEEGRRYLKYTSKISNDIKKVFRLKGSKLAFSTVESLHSTLDALDPQNCKDNVTVAYHCRPGDEGFGIQTMSALQYYRRYMTMAEIFTHLDFLQKLSSEPNGKKELTKWLGVIVALFKEMLLEYNDSEMNIIVTNILNNLLTRDMIVQEKSDMPKVMMVADTATEPIHMKTEANQMPIPKKPNKKQHSSNRLKSCLRVAAKRNAFASNLNYQHETAKYEGKSQVIVVPREK